LIHTLACYLYDRQTLLLLDNFEQVLAAGPQIAELLEACPKVKIIVTSRASLRLRAERELPVPPLATPPSKQDVELSHLSQYSAVQLFIQRAQASNPNFSVTNKNAPAIAEICHRLEGLPLAIELASARIKMLSPAALLSRLERRFEVLRGGTRDLPERQHTLYRAIDWSYNLLNEVEKRLFRQLAVFMGGWTLEAAEAVCTPDEPTADVFDLLERLIEHNLVKLYEEISGEPRLQMFESIREFAMERLLESGEFDDLHQRHEQYYLALATRAYPELISSRQSQWMLRLRVEHDNLRAALAWSQYNNIELGLNLCAAIWRFWVINNNFCEGRRWLERFISLAPEPTEARSKVLHAAAVFAIYQADYQVAHVYVQEALSLFEQQGNQRGIATGLNELGLIAMYKGDFPVAQELIEKSLVIKRRLGDQWLIANSYANLGLISSYQNDYVSAYTFHQKSLDIYSALDETTGVAIANGNLGLVALHLGRLDEAHAKQSKSLVLFNEVGDIDGATECLERLAMVANATADPLRAARLFGAASVFRIKADTALPPSEQAEYDRELQITRGCLEPEVFNQAWTAGQAMTLEQATAYGLE
jgi:predicted ATPase